MTEEEPTKYITPDNIKESATQLSFSSPNFHSTCIICDKCDRQYLRITWAFDIDWRVREDPILLSDEKLIATLNEGNTHSIETKYHANCLRNSCSKLRTIKK